MNSGVAMNLSILVASLPAFSTASSKLFSRESISVLETKRMLFVSDFNLIVSSLRRLNIGVSSSRKFLIQILQICDLP
jgi:hypothetical protein